MKYKLLIIPLVLLVILFFLFFFWWQPPVSFPINTIYSVKEGAGISKTATDLCEKSIIKSEFWFKSFLVMFGGLKGLKAGDYALADNQSVFAIAYRLSHADYRLDLIKITIPEGLNVFEISKIISQKFPQITSEQFIKEAAKEEGYLFPDTYNFLPNSTAKEILSAFKENFQIKIKTIESEITKFGKPLGDVIKLASILEEEARTTETRQIVAGILWKRLLMDMPLQVDASFKYINGKGTKDLTLDDLKIDSPYNSYLYKGLPPTPISNPGLEAIRAAISPIKTDYLYFLSDKNGVMHYAKTYSAHLQNKELYLK
jgi:UPF0755 protein